MKCCFQTRGGRRQPPIELTSASDHITELGFVNDGYDYTQHLKPMGTCSNYQMPRDFNRLLHIICVGGGRFIGVDGRVRDLPSVYIPDDAMASTEKECVRDLKTITISNGSPHSHLSAAPSC